MISSAASFGKRRRARVRQVLRHIQQRLLLIIEVAGHHQRSRVLGCPAGLRRIRMFRRTASVAEVRITVSTASKSFSSRIGGDINGRGLQKTSAAAPLHPVHETTVVAPAPEFQLLASVPPRGGAAAGRPPARSSSACRCVATNSKARRTVVVASPDGAQRTPRAL